jgi:hypothetical protein
MTKIIPILLITVFSYSLCCGQVKGTGNDIVVNGTSNESFRKSLIAIKASLSEADRKVLDDALEIIGDYQVGEHDAAIAIQRQFEAVTKGENVAFDPLSELRSRFHGKTAAEIITMAEYVFDNESRAAVERFDKTMDETIDDLKNAKRIKPLEKHLLNSVHVLHPALNRKDGQKINEIEFGLENTSEFTIASVAVKASYVDLKRGELLAVKVLAGCSPDGELQEIEPHKTARIHGSIISPSVISPSELSEVTTNIWNVALNPDAVLLIEVMEIQDEHFDTIAGGTFSEEERQEGLEIAKMQKYMSFLIDYRKRAKSLKDDLGQVSRPWFLVLTSKDLFKEALEGDSKRLHEKFDPMIQPENLRDFETMINNAQIHWKSLKMFQQIKWKRQAVEQTAPPH